MISQESIPSFDYSNICYYFKILQCCNILTKPYILFSRPIQYYISFLNFTSIYVDIYSVCISNLLCSFSWCMPIFYQPLLQSLDLFVWYVLVCLFAILTMFLKGTLMSFSVHRVWLLCLVDLVFSHSPCLLYSKIIALFVFLYCHIKPLSNHILKVIY